MTHCRWLSTELLLAAEEKQGWGVPDPMWPNSAQAYVSTTLDGSTYPGLKASHFTWCKHFLINEKCRKPLFGGPVMPSTAIETIVKLDIQDPLINLVTGASWGKCLAPLCRIFWKSSVTIVVYATADGEPLVNFSGEKVPGRSGKLGTAAISMMMSLSIFHSIHHEMSDQPDSLGWDGWGATSLDRFSNFRIARSAKKYGLEK